VPRPPTVIQRIERVVPAAIWVVLAAAVLFAAMAGAVAVWSGRRVRSHAAQLAAMSAAALTDPLTGVLNRRGFAEAVERELARARRYGRPFVLAYVDVRGLKAVNDTEGHRAGDALLREAAQLLQDSARADDVVGRIGGDEMGLLLVEQAPEDIAAVTDRIEEQVLGRKAAMSLRSSWDLTIGTATFPEDGETFDELLRAADLRLYEQRGISLQ
jgi:diguanylate cyclase (GGDEF)-like protein